MTIAAELGGATRFAAARQVMALTGLVPSEYSSGARQRRAAPAAIRCAWVAQHRLHARYRRLVGRGKSPRLAVTAVAPE